MCFNAIIRIIVLKVGFCSSFFRRLRRLRQFLSDGKLIVVLLLSTHSLRSITFSSGPSQLPFWRGLHSSRGSCVYKTNGKTKIKWGKNRWKQQKKTPHSRKGKFNMHTHRISNNNKQQQQQQHFVCIFTCKFHSDFSKWNFRVARRQHPLMGGFVVQQHQTSTARKLLQQRMLPSTANTNTLTHTRRLIFLHP